LLIHCPSSSLPETDLGIKKSLHPEKGREIVSRGTTLVGNACPCISHFRENNAFLRICLIPFQQIPSEVSFPGLPPEMLSATAFPLCCFPPGTFSIIGFLLDFTVLYTLRGHFVKRFSSFRSHNGILPFTACRFPVRLRDFIKAFLPSCLSASVY